MLKVVYPQDNFQQVQSPSNESNLQLYKKKWSRLELCSSLEKML